MAMQFGGWYNNPAQGGKNMRYWGGDTWTMGEDPTGGRGENWQSSGVSAPQTEGDYRSILGSAMASREQKNAQLQAEQEAAMSKYSSDLGIPGIQNQLSTTREEVSKVKGLLSNLEGDINQRTTGELLTESQRRRLLASEESPLRTQLANLVNSEDVATQQLALANTELDRRLSPLLARIASDQALSEADWELASQMAVQERQYQQEIEKIKLQSSITKQNDPTYEEFKALFNIGGTGASTSTPAASTIAPTYNKTLDDIFGNWIPGTVGSSATLRF